VKVGDMVDGGEAIVLMGSLGKTEWTYPRYEGDTFVGENLILVVVDDNCSGLATNSGNWSYFNALTAFRVTRC